MTGRLRWIVAAGLIGAFGSPSASARAQMPAGEGGASADSVTSSAVAWRMPPMPRPMPMVPVLMRLRPPSQAYLPGAGLDPGGLPEAVFRSVISLRDGDTLSLTARFVRRTIRGRTFVMYGFNGQYPGPLIRVAQGSRIVVDFHNEIDLPTTVHWHGVRIDNRFDGVPGVTQEPVPPGGAFVYEVRFPDAGIYWYHPHVREDIQQDLGLYGNMLVDSPDPDYYGPVNREEVLTLDDLLIDSDGLFPFGRESATHALMGRFGNVFLTNGEPDYELSVRRGEVVRFFLTDVSNTRTFNLSFGDAPLKVVAADVSKFEREERVESIAIAPAQRYVVEARFEHPGVVPITNRVQAIDHFRGIYYPEVDTLGFISVSEQPAAEDFSVQFETLRENADVAADIERYRTEFDRPVDHELTLTVRAGALPTAIVQIMSLDTLYQPPVEWNDAMPLMNYASSARDMRWILRDPATGRENMDIHWKFRQGEVAKIRIHNARRAFHPMQHPMHFHGQRLLALSRDGVPNHNLAWKDTVVIPVGSTVDVLLEASNPGRWVAHCHIAEHLEAGMVMAFTVEPTEGGAADAGSGAGPGSGRSVGERKPGGGP
ncbi:MAG: multicopper oxidase family protein [Gemmatimonadota bacterium]